MTIKSDDGKLSEITWVVDGQAARDPGMLDQLVKSTEAIIRQMAKRLVLSRDLAAPVMLPLAGH